MAAENYSKPPGSQHPSVPPLGDWLELARQLTACTSAIDRGLAEVGRRLGLSTIDLLLLWTCSLGGASAISQRQLARRLGISPAQVSATVEQLRRRKLLQGHRPAKDRRRQIWRLTDDGRATLASALEALDPLTDRWSQPCDPIGITALSALLDGLVSPSRDTLHPAGTTDAPGRKRGAA